MTLVTENQRVSVTEAYSDQSVIEQIRRLKKLKQDKLTAGENITIEGNVISAAGGSEAAWGSITGDLDDQTDLKEELTGIVDRIDDNAEAIEALDTAKADVGASYTKAEEDALLAAKQNKLTAGQNISIVDDVISATGGGGGSPEWGNITGDLDDQTDLKYALNSKANIFDTYTKDETDVLLSYKADTTYVDNHITDTSNPHMVSKAQVGLGNVDNTSDLSKPVSTATQTALDGKVPTSRKVNGHALTGDVTVTKSDVGLGNVDNTTDLNKPVSTAMQTALNAKQNTLTPAAGSLTSMDTSKMIVHTNNPKIYGKLLIINSEVQILTNISSGTSILQINKTMPSAQMITMDGVNGSYSMRVETNGVIKTNRNLSTTGDNYYTISAVLVIN